MNRLQLATLLSWAGESGVQGRKRLQKVVYFLQQAGCQLDCRYTLHHFGPYSRDVADVCDEMVVAGLIEEGADQQPWGTQYRYTVTPKTQELLREVTDDSMQTFKSLGDELLSEDLWQLELGSTILFFYGPTQDWNAALGKACEFKKASSTAVESKAALELARRVREHARN